MLKTSVADPLCVDADLDPDPHFQFDADPDSDPDPDRHQNDANPHADITPPPFYSQQCQFYFLISGIGVIIFRYFGHHI